MRRDAGGIDAFGARAGTKTGEQEAAGPQAGPTRSEPAPARKQENRKYFTEVPHASCSPVFGMARGGSPCLLFSCFPARRAEAPHASCSHVPDLNTRAGGRALPKRAGPGACGAAQRRQARAEDAERAGGEALRTGVGCGTARHALQRIPRLSARSVPSAVPPEAGGRVQAFTSRSGPRRRPPRGSRRAGRESPRRPSSLRRRSGGRRPSARRRSRKAPSRQ